MHNRYKADYNQKKGPARQQAVPKQSIYGVTTNINDLPKQAKNQGRDSSNGPYIRSSNPNNKKKIGSQSRINGTSFQTPSDNWGVSKIDSKLSGSVTPDAQSNRKLRD